MNNIEPTLREKFLQFREVYEASRIRLEDSGASGSVVAQEVWIEAMTAVPLTNDKLRLYKMHVAMQSVNGGELFAVPDDTEE